MNKINYFRNESAKEIGETNMSHSKELRKIVKWNSRIHEQEFHSRVWQSN
jgi:hypothetical protein